MDNIKLVSVKGLYDGDWFPDITTTDGIKTDSEQILKCKQTDWILTELCISRQSVKLGFEHPARRAGETEFIEISIQEGNVLQFEVRHTDNASPDCLTVDCVVGEAFWEEMGITVSEYTCRITEWLADGSVRRISIHDDGQPRAITDV